MAESSRRHRSPRWRLSIVLLLIGITGVAAFGLPWIRAAGDDAAPAGGGAAAEPTRQPSGPAVRWHGGLLQPGEPERVTIYFIGGSREGSPVGPCSPAYEAAAKPSPTTIEITLYKLPTQSLGENHACTAMGFQRSLVVQLPEPLRGRALVDGATGERQKVFDARRLLDPTYLPDGYRLAQDGTVMGDGYFMRTWAKAGGEYALIEVALGGPELARRPTHQEVVLARPTIRGEPAKVSKSKDFDDSICAAWTEGELGRRVCTQGDPDALLPVPELVRVADGLRPTGG